MRLLHLLLLAGLLAACNTSGAGDIDDDSPVVVLGEDDVAVTRGAPDWAMGPNSGVTTLGIDDDGHLVVVTFGSSSNPLRVVAAQRDGNEVKVELDLDRDRPSTMDFVPTTSLVDFGSPLSTEQVTKVDLGAHGAVEIGPDRGVPVELELE